MANHRFLWWWIGGTAAASALAFTLTWAVVSSPTSEPPEPDAIAIPVGDATPPVFDPPDLSGPPRPSGEWGWFELRGSECLADPPSQTSSLVVVVDCDTPHRAKYLSPILYSTDETAPYPGEEALLVAASDHCREITPGDAELGEEVTDALVYGVFSADELSWQAGHRVMGCVVTREAGGTLPPPPVAPQSEVVK